MAQTYADIDQTTGSVTAVFTILDVRTDTLQSSFSGAGWPASPVVGQIALNTAATPHVLGLYSDFDGGGVGWHQIAVCAELSADMECDFQQLKEMRVENLGAHEAVAAGKDGYIYFLTTTGHLYFQDQAVDGVNRHVCSVVDGVTTDSRPIPLSSFMHDATNPPTLATKGTTPTIRGWLYDAVNELSVLPVRVPDNYSADANLTLRLACVLNQAETNGDDIDWSADVVAGTAPFDVEQTSTAAAASLTDTGTDAGDGLLHHCDIVIDYDDGDNPVIAGDWLFVEIHRTDIAEVGGVILIGAELVYPCDGGVQ